MRLQSARCLLLGTQDVSHLLSSQMHFGTISELPVSSDLWIGYTSYLDKNLKVLIETSLPIHVDSIMMIFYLFNTKRCFSLQVPSVLSSVYYRTTRTAHGLLSYGSIIRYLWSEFILLKNRYAM